MATTPAAEHEPPPQRRSASRIARVARSAPPSRTCLAHAVAAAGVVTLLVCVGAIWRDSPVRVIENGALGASAGSALHLPAAYTILSPLCEAYDALTLLTLPQHAALLGWLLATFAAIRAARWVRRGREAIDIRSAWRRAGREMFLFAAVVMGFAIVYVAGAIVPRPMAGLVLDDRDELAVDVHSHTSESHDGRPGFDAEANRRWHSAAGFAGAYITDHRKYEGAIAGARGNPPTAGDGTVLLPGIELAAPHSHVTILGARPEMRLDDNGQVDSARVAAAQGVVIVLTVPVGLSGVPRTLGLNAVEVSDGAPRGLLFTRRMAPAIVRFAASRGLVAVAGSNNHGWGRTASAWTVLRIPGWRALSPDSLDRAIRSTLLHGSNAVRVVARASVALPRSAFALVTTPALLIWSIVTRLSTAERVSWLVWGWSVAMVALVFARRVDPVDSGDHALPSASSLPHDYWYRDRARRRARQRG